MANKITIPIPQDSIGENFRWRDWLQRLSDTVYGSMAAQDYTSVSITGGTITNTTLSNDTIDISSIINSSISTSNIEDTTIGLVFPSSGYFSSLRTIGLTGFLYGNGSSDVTAVTSIPSSSITGLGTMSSQNSNSVTITGGTINGTSIGATTPAAVTGSNLMSSGGVYAKSTYSGSTYIDGMLIDYSTGWGRFSVGTADGFIWYNGGLATTELARMDTSGVLYTTQPTPTALTATTTLTIAYLQTLIITVTSATAVTLTLPTGTLTDAGIAGGALANNKGFDWSIINLGSSAGAVTMAAGTAHTYVGSATVAIGTSASFRTRKTATNTYITYRIS
jgi:hypothetical protein